MLDVLEVGDPGALVIRVRPRFRDDLGQSDDRLLVACVIDDGGVAGLHLLDGVDGGRVAHAVPLGLAVALEVIKRVRVRIGLGEEVGHRVTS